MLIDTPRGVLQIKQIVRSNSIHNNVNCVRYSTMRNFIVHNIISLDLCFSFLTMKT